VQIWIGKDYLEQLNKNIHSSTITDDDVFDAAVEYTDVAVMQGQIAVSIKYDTYIELTDRGLLVEWSGINTDI
tara:strand:+ start:2444 stop:2662 length:219 start_codon:yes stop_codon:yes gene_type:complete